MEEKNEEYKEEEKIYDFVIINSLECNNEYYDELVTIEYGNFSSSINI